MSPRRMEEASVAGESPDKSKQQESSGTTRGESDPRLAVFREPPAEAEARGGTDTATAVFRTGSSGDGEGGKADTATAVFRTRPSGDDEDGKRGESPAAREVSSDGEASGDSEASTGAEGDEGTERAEKAAQGPEKASEAPEPAKSAADADGAEDTDAAEPADAAPEAGDARLRAAVAAWVSKDGGEGDESGEGSKDAGDAKDGDDAKGAMSESAAEPDADADAAASDDDAPDGATASGDDASDEARVAGSREKTSDTEEVDGAEASEGEAEVTAGAADAGDAGDGAKAKGADDAAKAKRSDKAKNADDAEDTGKDTAEAKDVDDADAADGEDKNDTSEGKRGVDQPTAVFRAPAAAKVDQPTTALKITRPVSKPDAESKPESAAERTSKFVPLRGDDVRPAPAAPRKPEAPAAPSAATSPAPALSTAERTTQQPMPPRPPLDLLAELTNTPPPPETPVRTAVRRVKIWTPLVLLLLIIFAIVQMVRPLPDPKLQMSAKPTYTFKGSKPSLPWPNEGQGYMAATGLGTVGSFGEQKAVPIGSVAKAMTAYIVLKDHPLKKGEDGPSITIDAKAESDGKLSAVNESTLDTVKEGDKLTEKQALTAIMIPSANNIARLLARWDAGSEAAFVKKMNDTAKSLGMKNTTYTDPSGLNATTVSTAEDQVKLGEKLVEIPALMAITVLPSWTDPSGHVWPNWNKLVPYNGSLGIKTGTTTKAGGNLLFAAHKMVGETDQLIVGAVLGQHKQSIIDTVNAVSKDVMIATQDLLEDAKVIKKGDVVGTVSDGLGGSTPVIATKDVSAVGWSGLTVKLDLNDDGKTIPHSAAAGTHVGTLTVGEGRSQVKVPVALKSDLVEPTFGDKLTRLG
ncbi:D-alanyl-D-alanine carboxypeptidase [Streptomyces sp. NPDC047515]|uniref:D-alanyl-D-alanine carboxypeptidase n=1 Tax=Streptomyces sp. NPDC047515 TaxID=3155380 RepID=UPI0033F3C957